MTTAMRTWALGGALSSALASGTAYSAALGPVDVATVRDCYAANAPRKSSVLGIHLTVRNAAGEETESHFKLYWRRLRTGERRVMIRFSAPDDLAGTGVLVEGVRKTRPRVHLYLPDLGEPKRVTSRAQLEGFLGRADLGLDEIGQILDPLGSKRLSLIDADAALDERAVWVLEARPEQDDPSRYARTVTFVDRELCVPLRAEFYDRAGKRARLLRVDPARVTREASSWIAREMVFQNGEGENGARTTLRIDEVEVDIPLAPSLLTVRALPGIGG